MRSLHIVYKFIVAAKRYLWISIFFAVFGGIYEYFSHGVYSYFMIYAFMIPLVLGTVPTMREGSFRKALEESGIRAVVPGEQSQERIGRIIEGELELGVVREDSAEAIRAIAEDAAARGGAEAVVLGCTELPLIWGKTGCALPAVDAMRCHIRALCKAIESSMGN